jgi:sec-independent protein translocase protein TatA
MGLSFWHLLIILVIVFILFGNRLPNLGKNLGEAIRGFKKGLDGEEIDVTNTAKRNEQIRDAETNASHVQHEEKKEKV